MHEDAVKLRLSRPLIDSLESVVVHLENEKASLRSDYSELLSLEQQKNKSLSEKYDAAIEINSLSNQEKDVYRKQVRRVKWQRNGLGGLLAVVVVLALI